MALALATFPVSYFPVPSIGKPIFNGQIFIGNENTDPEILANRKDVIIKDEKGVESILTAIEQPIRTNSGGAPSANGSAVHIMVDDYYSITVLDSRGNQLYHAPRENNFLVGPEGTAGATGNDGPTGPAGPNGAQGATGSTGVGRPLIGDIVMSYDNEASLNDRGLLLTGTTVSRTTYSELYAILLAAGVAGDGDGFSTFDIPQLEPPEIVGSQSVTWTDLTMGAGSPNWVNPVSVDYDDNNDFIYAVDLNLQNIYKKTLGAGGWSTTGGIVPWSTPRNVVVEKLTQDLFACDSGLNNLYKRDFNIGTWELYGDGDPTPLWDTPEGLAIDEITEDLYATDTSIKEIWLKDGTTQDWIELTNEQGAPNWASPFRLDLDQTTKDLYVTDNVLGGIFKRDGSLETWTFISGSAPWTTPEGIILDQATRDLYVSTSNPPALWKFDKATSVWSDIGTDPNAPSWSTPRSVSMNQSTKEIFIVDQGLKQFWKRSAVTSSQLNKPLYYIKAI